MARLDPTTPISPASASASSRPAWCAWSSTSSRKPAPRSSRWPHCALQAPPGAGPVSGQGRGPAGGVISERLRDAGTGTAKAQTPSAGGNVITTPPPAVAAAPADPLGDLIAQRSTPPSPAPVARWRLLRPQLPHRPRCRRLRLVLRQRPYRLRLQHHAPPPISPPHAAPTASSSWPWTPATAVKTPAPPAPAACAKRCGAENRPSAARAHQ